MPVRMMSRTEKGRLSVYIMGCDVTDIPEGRRILIMTENVSNELSLKMSLSAYKAKICQISGVKEGDPS